MESQPIAIRTVPSAVSGPVHEVVRQAHEELRQLLQQRAEVMRRNRNRQTDHRRLATFSETKC